MDLAKSDRPASAAADVALRRMQAPTASDCYAASRPITAALARAMRVVATLDPSAASTALPQIDGRRTYATRAWG